MAKLRLFFVLALAITCVKAHVAYIGLPNRLHQVANGIYVNPSSDGTSDLYVAATEDHGVKTWLADHPVKYLQPGQMPVAYTTTITQTSLPHEEVVTNQKRAVITSPPVKYAYALPVSSEGNQNQVQTIPYPYSVPTSAAPQTEGTECGDPMTAAYPYALHWYYSQMMAAFANALNNAAKDSSEDVTSTTTASTPAASAWPSYPYPYPVQYVMVDPSAWAKSQATSSTTTPDPSVANASNESA